MKEVGVFITPLQRIVTTGGDVLHAMKQSDKGFAGFGEAYFSWVAADVIKGWKRHTKMTMNLIVPVGQVRFVFSWKDEHNRSVFRAEEIGEHRYVRITVPPGVWFAFKGMGMSASMVLNIASIPHDPNEVERLALSDFDYMWS